MIIPKFIRNLRQRAASVTEIEWKATVNNVVVGQIADNTLAKIQLDTYTDKYLYLKQAMNFINSLTRAIFFYAVGLPLVIGIALFWLLVLQDPIGLITTLREATSSDLVSFFYPIIGISSTVYLYFIVFNHRSFGFKNCFKEAQKDAVRQNLNQPNIGALRLLLVRQESDYNVYDIQTYA